MSAPRPSRLGLACAALALAFAAPALADFRQAFRKGIEAFDHQDWAGVVRFMREAINEQPREGEQVRVVGMRFEAYLPHYYLGLGLYHGGDCAGALKEWEASTAQGAVQGTPQFATLTRLAEECRRALSVATAAPRPAATAAPVPTDEIKRAEAELSRANEAAAAVAALRRDPGLAPLWLAQPSFAGRADAAQGKLATAHGWLEAGRSQGDRAQLVRAAALAGEAGKDLDALRTEVEARRGEFKAAQARPTAGARPELAQALPTSAPAPTPGPAAPGIVATRPVEPTRSAPPSPGKPVPPPELRAAASALFGGDYRGAAALLANANFPEPRAAAVALLLRAASRYALYLEGGGTDEALRAQASADVRACRRLDAALLPDRAFFSPRFTEFFRQVR